ncbi:MAG: hypothetical protein AAF206_32300 [Bacteroidota bacterium]
MWRKLFLLPTLAFILASCSVPDPFHTLEGHWTLDHYEYLTEQFVYPKPDHVDGEVSVTFSDNGRRGDFVGHTIMNPFQGKYQIASNGKMEVSEIAGNLQRDPDWADQFWDALADADSYQIRGDFLDIFYEGGLRKMVFVRN